MDDNEYILYKYPRDNTDIVVIIFLMHEDYLRKLSKSYDELPIFHCNLR